LKIFFISRAKCKKVGQISFWPPNFFSPIHL
jgi:hypothetical protein